MTNFKKIKSKRYKAFSFVEVIISVFVISVGLIASVGLISTSLSGSMDSRKQIVASLLAQEGIEQIRNIRDNNWIDNDPATASFSGISGSTTELRYTDDVGYGDSGSATPFTRRITVANGSSADEKIITSAVIWKGTAFPTIDEAHCNTASWCAFTQIRLNNWGE